MVLSFRKGKLAKIPLSAIVPLFTFACLYGLMFRSSFTPCSPSMVDFECPTTWRMNNFKRFSCPKGKNFYVFFSIHVSSWRTNAKIYNCKNQGRINNVEIEMILNFDDLLCRYSITGYDSGLVRSHLYT